MRQERKTSGKDKSPYNRREEKDDKKAFKVTSKSVKPVAKDTNKTRRKMVKPTETGEKIKMHSPVSGHKLKGGISKIKQRGHHDY